LAEEAFLASLPVSSVSLKREQLSVFIKIKGGLKIKLSFILRALCITFFSNGKVNSPYIGK
jgi:hypothetical protein